MNRLRNGQAEVASAVVFWLECSGRQGLSPKWFRGLYPKAGESRATSVLAKLGGNTPLRAIVADRSEYALYWVRVPGYFCQFFLAPPKAQPETGGPARPRGELNELLLPDEPTLRVFHALLNSSTYYQFFSALTDGRHINPSDVLGFPWNPDRLTALTRRRLGDLSKRLDHEMKRHTRQARKSGLLIDSVDSRSVKTTLDEIDIVLARHYGFTDEELDFIINYDIKYRVGADAADEE